MNNAPPPRRTTGALSLRRPALSPLVRATQSGSTEQVRQILENPQLRRAQLHTVDEDGSTPIAIAAERGNTELLLLFFRLTTNRDIDVNSPDSMGNTPLMLAVQADQYEAVDLLLRRPGLAINQFNDDGDTAAHIAVRRNNIDIIERLLSEPTLDLSIRNMEHQMPIDIAIRDGNDFLLDLLAHEMRLRRHPGQGNNDEFYIGEPSNNNGNNNGNNGNNGNNRTPTLFRAPLVPEPQHLRNEDQINLVSQNTLEAGNTYIIAPNATGTMRVVGKEDTVRNLIDRGYKGSTQTTVFNPVLNKLQPLSEMQRTQRGFVGGRRHTRRTRGAKGKRTNRKMKTQTRQRKQQGGVYTVWDAVKSNTLEDFFNRLPRRPNFAAISNDEWRETPFLYTVHNSKIEICMHLIAHRREYNISVNESDQSKGRKALMWACENMNLILVQQLLDAGAYPNLRDFDGVTAIRYISYDSPREDLKLRLYLTLRQRGADPSILNVYGQSLLMDICEFSGNGSIMIDILRTYGYRRFINAQDEDGWTALMYAVTHQKPQYVQLLMDAGADPQISNNDGKTAFQMTQDPELLDILNGFANNNANSVPGSVPGSVPDSEPSSIRNNNSLPSSLNDAWFDMERRAAGNTSGPIVFGNVNNIPPVENEWSPNMPNIDPAVYDVRPEALRKIQGLVVPESRTCANPASYGDETIKDTHTLFYIETRAGVLQEPVCVEGDEEFESLLQGTQNLYFQCTAAAPAGALAIHRRQTGQAIRRLPFTTGNYYVRDAQATSMRPGGKYLLRPTTNHVGRIASYYIVHATTKDLMFDATSREHCATDHSDEVLYDVFEVEPAIGQKRRKTQRMRRRAQRKN